MFQSILWRYVGRDICDSYIKSQYLEVCPSSVDVRLQNSALTEIWDTYLLF